MDQALIWTKGSKQKEKENLSPQHLCLWCFWGPQLFGGKKVGAARNKAGGWDRCTAFITSWCSRLRAKMLFLKYWTRLLTDGDVRAKHYLTLFRSMGGNGSAWKAAFNFKRHEGCWLINMRETERSVKVSFLLACPRIIDLDNMKWLYWAVCKKACNFLNFFISMHWLQHPAANCAKPQESLGFELVTV